MQRRKVMLLFVYLLLIAIYIGARRYLLGPLYDKEIYIFILGLLIGLNMFYYVLSVTPGKERWLIYAIFPLSIIYILTSNTKNFILPMGIVLCVLIAVNTSRIVSRIFGNRNPSGPI